MLIVVATGRRGQGLVSVLDKWGPVDLRVIMTGTYDLAMTPVMVLHMIQGLHACQMAQLRGVSPNGGTTGADVDVRGAQ